MNAATSSGKVVAQVERSGGHAFRAVAIGASFAALLATGIYSGRDLNNYFRGMVGQPMLNGAGNLSGQARSQPGRAGSHSVSAQGEALRPLDPAHSFIHTGVGELLFSTRNSNHCRRVLFDNRTGTLVDVGSFYCGLPAEPGDQIGQERALSMLRAFRKDGVNPQ